MENRKKSMNWKQYNRELIRMGEILMDPEIIKEWDNELSSKNEGKEGRR